MTKKKETKATKAVEQQAPADEKNVSKAAEQQAPADEKNVSKAASASEEVVLTPTHIIVQGPANGFRRCGHRFNQTAQCLPIDTFSDEQLKRLLAEPCLKVTFKTEA